MNKKALVSLSALAVVASGLLVAPAANANPYWHAEAHRERIAEHRAIERQVAHEQFYAAHPYFAPVARPFHRYW